MMRLIDADVLIADICQDQCERKYCDCDSTCSLVAFAVNAPTIPAVPLEPLCEWLSAGIKRPIMCDLCQKAFPFPQKIGCPPGKFICGDKEHWKIVLTKLMEGT